MGEQATIPGTRRVVPAFAAVQPARDHLGAGAFKAGAVAVGQRHPAEPVGTGELVGDEIRDIQDGQPDQQNGQACRGETECRPTARRARLGEGRHRLLPAEIQALGG